MADENKARDPLARLAEGGVHFGRIGPPAGDPAGHEPEGVRSKKQVHAHGSARQLLLPHRDLVIFDRRRDQHDELRRKMGELFFLGEVPSRRLRILSLQGVAKQPSKSVALVVGNGHETPRREFAVIRNARGDGQDSLHLLRRGAGPQQLPRLSGAAGFKKGKDRRSVVEH